MGLVSSGQLAICAYFIQTTLKHRIIYVFNGPEPTLGALRVFHHPKNEIADADIRTICPETSAAFSHCIWKSWINLIPLRSYLPPHSWHTHQSPLYNSAYLDLDQLKKPCCVIPRRAVLVFLLLASKRQTRSEFSWENLLLWDTQLTSLGSGWLQGEPGRWTDSWVLLQINLHPNSEPTWWKLSLL